MECSDVDLMAQYQGINGGSLGKGRTLWYVENVERMAWPGDTFHRAGRCGPLKNLYCFGDGMAEYELVKRAKAAG